jgi:hypothetical protein
MLSIVCLVQCLIYSWIHAVTDLHLDISWAGNTSFPKCFYKAQNHFTKGNGDVLQWAFSPIYMHYLVEDTPNSIFRDAHRDKKQVKTGKRQAQEWFSRCISSVGSVPLKIQGVLSCRGLNTFASVILADLRYCHSTIHQDDWMDDCISVNSSESIRHASLQSLCCQVLCLLLISMIGLWRWSNRRSCHKSRAEGHLRVFVETGRLQEDQTCEQIPDLSCSCLMSADALNFNIKKCVFSAFRFVGMEWFFYHPFWTWPQIL